MIIVVSWAFVCTCNLVEMIHRLHFVTADQTFLNGPAVTAVRPTKIVTVAAEILCEGVVWIGVVWIEPQSALRFIVSELWNEAEPFRSPVPAQFVVDTHSGVIACVKQNIRGGVAFS